MADFLKEFLEFVRVSGTELEQEESVLLDVKSFE
jgi:hypothetical protein